MDRLGIGPGAVSDGKIRLSAAKRRSKKAMPSAAVAMELCPARVKFKLQGSGKVHFFSSGPSVWGTSINDIHKMFGFFPSLLLFQS